MTQGFILLAALPALHANVASTMVVPTHFEADRVFAVPQTENGETLKLFMDTGGGGNLLCRSAAERLHLALEPMPTEPELESELGKDLSTTLMPPFRAGLGIPANADGNGSFVVHDCLLHGGKFAAGMGDGLLSSRWFASRVWTWDYPAHKVTIEDSGWKPEPSARRVALGFRKASADNPEFHMPRLTVRVDGQDLDLLLDTGASGHPTAAAQSAQGGDAVDGSRATSFITTSTLEAWHRAHPDWLVVADGDDLFAPRLRARLIRVPHVEIAGWSVGPV